jgi:hypothetical protein
VSVCARGGAARTTAGPLECLACAARPCARCGSHHATHQRHTPAPHTSATPTPPLHFTTSATPTPPLHCNTQPTRSAPFEFYDPASPIYTSPRFLPPAKIEDGCQIRVRAVGPCCAVLRCVALCCVVCRVGGGCVCTGGPSSLGFTCTPQAPVPHTPPRHKQQHTRRRRSSAMAARSRAATSARPWWACAHTSTRAAPSP